MHPEQLLGIPLALLGAVFLALGAQFQHRGVAKTESASGNTGSTGLSLSTVVALALRPSWLLGTVMLGLAIVLQLSALSFSPIVVVQPLGVVALVVTAITQVRGGGGPVNRQSTAAIGMCVGGVAVFVGVAAFTTVDHPVTDTHLIVILAILATVLAVLTVAFVRFRARARALFYIASAGMIYGFVATLAKAVITRIEQQQFDPLTLVCLVVLVAATFVGGYFVQTAYASGPPELVVAGLTVIDPMVAVAIGVVVLGEAGAAPVWAVVVFVAAGAVAVAGVFRLARYRPRVD
jgi:drug/metabolite transporter (DMT)-like permease